MDKRIIIGAVSGLILGALQSWLFGYGGLSLLVIAILGAAVGFFGSKISVGGSYYLTSAAIGVVFYGILMLLKMTGAGPWWDELLTGGITGAAIGFISNLINGKLSS